MKIISIVQARMGSTRLPGKVMKPICGYPMLGLLLKRLSKSNEVSKIILATTEFEEDNTIADYANELGFDVFRGSKDDVLSRYYYAATKYSPDAIVRITGDCPFVDAQLVDSIIRRFQELDVDYLSNYHPPSFPDGLDVSVFTFEALAFAFKNATTKFDREYIESYIRSCGKFKLSNYENDNDYSKERWTVDEEVDFKVAKNIFEYFSPDIYFDFNMILKLLFSKPKLFEANREITRNEGSVFNSGTKLWKHAKNVIAGGNMLFSKRPDLYLPNLWPTYFSKTQDCFVWDMDNNKYIDMLFAVGTNILGYSHPEVDNAVKKSISDGIISSLNCPEEVYLADKLISMHPWSAMAKFARSGGEANAISIRIARAFTGKDKVAFCGYHGWHDWYLASGISDNEILKKNLMPGLFPVGVPQNLSGTIYPFEYNRLDQLQKIIETEDIGIVKMEVIRNQYPKSNFLKDIRELCTKKNIVLIFDECTSGFRQSYGGIHKCFDVNPDIAIFGKAIANGYPITAILGKREIMEAAQSTFISSTFWTERIGYVAALKTLEIMEKQKTWDVITNTGNKIKSIWEKLSKKYNIKLKIYGIPALIRFDFDCALSQEYKTLLSQEMLKHGFLASNLIYVSIRHSVEILLLYEEALDKVFSLIRKCEDGIYSINSLLDTSVCTSDFKRLN